jgi:UrcA family protein
MKTATLAIAAVMGASLAATPLIAQEPTQVQVSFADLNLETAEGRDALEKRLDNAARQACGYDDVMTGTRVRSSHAKSCYAKARKSNNERMARIVQNVGLGG